MENVVMVIWDTRFTFDIFHNGYCISSETFKDRTAGLEWASNEIEFLKEVFKDGSWRIEEHESEYFVPKVQVL